MRIGLLWIPSLILLNGCADYMNHRDSITFGLGNAVEANKAIHIRDPLNPQSADTTIYSDGRRVAKVMGEYYGTGSARQSSGGPCMNDGDTASDGSRCGGRSAASRPGG